jgi:U3 small nucleolar RNA-associated protein 19
MTTIGLFDGLSAALERCDAAATTFVALERAFDKHAAGPLGQLLRAPLAAGLSDSVSPASCCAPDVNRARVELVVPHDDVKLLVMRAVTALLKAERGGDKRRGASRKRVRVEDAPSAVVCANAYTLLYGVTFSTAAEVALRWPALAAEKRALEGGEAYANSNAAERRALTLGSVLAVFSARAHRAAFSALWAAFLALDLPEPLHLHFLTSVGTHVVLHMTNPLSLADYITSCFATGGLVAVLALQGIFLLIVEHGLEYPNFYKQLYSLVTPDSFGSRHRYQLFRLVNLCLTSVRVPAYIAAAFIKKIARVMLLSPTPTLYFSLPFLRQLLQRHPTCLKLIHRSAGEEDSDDETDASLGKAEMAAVAGRVARLFQGQDPFQFAEPSLEKCHAAESSLWELAILERHYLPAVSLMVTAFASPAQDTTPLRFEKTYGRLFAHDITRDQRDGTAVLAYSAPAKNLLSPGAVEPGMSGVFVA